MSEQSTRLRNQSTVQTHVCAQCWGALVEKAFDSGDGGLYWAVVCPRGCQPGGFATRAWAEEQRAKNYAEAVEVARNYPALAPDGLVPTKEQSECAKKALFGEEE